jgi:diaminopimelate epimerase
MTIYFHKYQGTGNDFIMIDNMNGDYSFVDIQHVKQLCDRRFGIGSDGLILINAHPTLDFEADYYNSDGSKSFCGNGARCAVQFYARNQSNQREFKFDAIDGIHAARIVDSEVSLEMTSVQVIEKYNNNFVLNTGSPHYVQYVDDLENLDVVRLGRQIRNSDHFNKAGINVNFVKQIAPKHISIRTYERGVEDETLSCGTGATACALVEGKSLSEGNHSVCVDVLGGQLHISFTCHEDGRFSDVTLQGPATFVFEGEINV